MSSRMKMRWIVVSCIWGLALAVTFWNGAKINSVAAARVNNDQRLREIDFQRQNTEKLAQVSKSHQALFLPVESVDLGIVAVRSQMRALAAAFDLKDVRIQTESVQNTGQMIGDQIPCKVTTRGGLGSAVGFLTALHKHLYLTIEKMTIASEKGSDQIEMQIELRLKYRIVNPPESSVAMPRLATGQGAEAL